ncbi:MAG: hypothetical protein WED34_04755 [Planctomycetales bacterium]
MASRDVVVNSSRVANHHAFSASAASRSASGDDEAFDSDSSRSSSADHSLIFASSRVRVALGMLNMLSSPSSIFVFSLSIALLWSFGAAG